MNNQSSSFAKKRLTVNHCKNNNTIDETEFQNAKVRFRTDHPHPDETYIPRAVESLAGETVPKLKQLFMKGVTIIENGGGIPRWSLVPYAYEAMLQSIEAKNNDTTAHLTS